MFGIWRTSLAVEVVAFHLLFLPFIGAYAVFSFFVLSGFLMTAIMHGTYGYSVGGFGRYLTNRALRLYPSYWFAIGVALLMIAALGAGRVAAYDPVIAVPQSAGQWAENLTIVFANIVPRDEVPRLVPLAWALTVEITYYIFIGLGASRTRRTTLLWMAASLGYAILAPSLHHPRDTTDLVVPMYQYSAIPAGSLPFSAGALAWHYRDALRSRLVTLRLGDPRILIVARWCLYLGFAALQARTGWRGLIMPGNWLNVGLSCLIVVTLFALRPEKLWRRIDKSVGDFSYPIYLLHVPMGLIAAIMLFGGPVMVRSPRALAVFVLGTVLTFAVGAVCARIIDPAVERLRTRLKAR